MMFRGYLGSAGALALIAAANLMVGGVSPVRAADLGGDCCADLEERVAELEATTVRKGNRKVSVTLYGQVNSAVLWYDNGEESDVYVVDNDTSMSRIGVKGSGKMRPGWEAGYRLEIGTSQSELSSVSENDDDDGLGSDVFIRHAFVYVKSDDLGKLSIGQQSTAADGIIDGIDLSGAAGWISYNGGSDWVADFAIFDSTAGAYSGVKWSNVLRSFDSSRRNVVRYDSPTWEGFSVSTSWGEDDQWDVAARYSKDWNGLNIAAGIGYYWLNDELAPLREREIFGASLSVYHAASGIFATGSYSDFAEDREPGAQDRDATSWYAKLGLRGNWSGAGETAVYAEYGNTDGNVVGDVDGDGNAADVDGTFWGVGVGQDIEAVGATAYLGYRHHEADLAAEGIDAHDMDAVIAGMVMPF